MLEWRGIKTHFSNLINCPNTKWKSWQSKINCRFAGRKQKLDPDVVFQSKEFAKVQIVLIL